MNREGAVSGMIVGIVFTASYIFYFTPQLGGPGTKDGFWFGISPEGIGTLGMLFNFIVSLTMSRLTQPVPEEIQELTESIRFPRGAGEAHDITIH
jgi:cation/acetate symporter